MTTKKTTTKKTKTAAASAEAPVKSGAVGAASASVRDGALVAARARWAEAGPPRKGSLPRAGRLEAVIAVFWQILSYASLSKVAVRLARMPEEELSPTLVADLRTATLAVELAAERAERAAALNRPGPAAASVLPTAREVLKRLQDGAEDFFADDPEVRAALDAIPVVRIGAVSLARHLGALSSLLAARIDGLGANTGRLKRPDLETARELRATLRPANIDGLDPETAEAELEHAFRWAEHLYEELAGALTWLDRRSTTAPRWPLLAGVGRKPRAKKDEARKDEAKKAASAGAGASSSPASTEAAPAASAASPTSTAEAAEIEATEVEVASESEVASEPETSAAEATGTDG
jgi:hypothetical protein